MAVKPCLGCGRLTTASRCATCLSRRYGRAHRHARADLVPVIHMGAVNCARCGQPIGATEPWALDHSDTGPGYIGPSHAYCNSRTEEPRR
jgi:hypothetical protein